MYLGSNCRIGLYVSGLLDCLQVQKYMLTLYWNTDIVGWCNIDKSEVVKHLNPGSVQTEVAVIVTCVDTFCLNRGIYLIHL